MIVPENECYGLLDIWITWFCNDVIFLCNAGDLGQTFDSNITLSHYESNSKGQTVLYVGDLSYADIYPDHDNVRWDTWGRFVERSTAYQPWIWTAGNHEIDFAPEIVKTSLCFLIYIFADIDHRSLFSVVNMIHAHKISLENFK